MSVPQPAPHGGLRISLPARLDADSVVRLYRLLSPLLHCRSPVIVAGSEVSQVDEAPLRALATFFRVRAASGDMTALVAVSEVLRSGARNSGLAADLGLDR